MFFVSNAEKSRHIELDRSIDAVDALLTRDVSKVLGKNPGRYTNILANLYIPNLQDYRRNGKPIKRLVTPSAYLNDTSIPIFSLGISESVYASRAMSTLHEDQIDILLALAQHNGHSDQVETVLPEATQALSERFAQLEPISFEIAASRSETQQPTVTNQAEVTVGSFARIVRARPNIYLPRVDVHNDWSLGLLLFHQLVHADQALHHKPVFTTQAISEHRSNENEARKLERKVARVSLKQTVSHRT